MGITKEQWIALQADSTKHGTPELFRPGVHEAIHSKDAAVAAWLDSIGADPATHEIREHRTVVGDGRIEDVLFLVPRRARRKVARMTVDELARRYPGIKVTWGVGIVPVVVDCTASSRSAESEH